MSNPMSHTKLKVCMYLSLTLGFFLFSKTKLAQPKSYLCHIDERKIFLILHTAFNAHTYNTNSRLS